MKKKSIMIILVCAFLLLLCIGVMFFLLPAVKEERAAYNTSVDDLFEKEGNFYVYFSRKECPYCNNIEKDIDNFKKENTVYEIDAEACNGILNYNWDEHEKQHDMIIGEKNEVGKVIFYEGLDEKSIKEKYPPINYKIVWVNDNYAELHEGKVSGKIYAISTHPAIDPEDLKAECFLLGGVPTLIEFDNHKVKNIYFDDKEIINFFNTTTKPLDEYWNLD